MNAPGGSPDRTLTPAAECLSPTKLIRLDLPQCVAGSTSAAKRQYKEGMREANESLDFIKRDRANQPAVDPWQFEDRKSFERELKKLGLRSTEQGKIVSSKGAAK